MAFAPVERTLDLPALEARVLAQLARRRRLRREPPRAAPTRPDGCSTRARPPRTAGRASTTSGPLVQGPLPPLPHDAGHLVARKAGWDCHGLPGRGRGREGARVLGQAEIEDFGIEAFNQRCRESVHRYVEDWSALTSRIGMWLDTSDAYWTLSNDYIESVWWLFHEMWDKAAASTRASRSSRTAVGAAPRCRATSSASPARTATSPRRRSTCASRCVDADFDLLVWTTTPWTLVSNVGAAVGPDVEYVRVRGREGGRDLVLAAGRVAAVLGDDAEIVGTGRRSTSSSGAGTSGRSTSSRVDADARPVPGRRRRLRHRRRRLGHRAPRARVRRDRPRGRRGRGARHAQPGRARGALRRLGAGSVRGRVREGRRPRAHRRARGAGPPRARRRLHALVPALLAVRHAAHLLGQAHVVRAHVGPQGRAAPRERADRLAPRAHPARALRRLAREQRRLGALARPLLGHADPGVALRRLRARHVRRLGRRPRRCRRDATSPTSTCTDRSSTTSASRARSAAAASYRVEPVLDAWFDSGSMPRRSSTTRSRTPTCSRRASRPTSSARRSTRPAAGSTRCSR